MGRTVRRGLGCVVVVASLTLFPSCTASQQPRGAAVQRVLDRQAAAVLDRDTDAYLRTVDPRATAYRAQQRQMMRNLARLPLAQWSYRVLAADDLSSRERATRGRWIAVRVQLRYRLRGYDHAPLTVRERLTFTARDGAWYLSSPTRVPSPDRDGAQQLWQQGELTVARGDHSLVIGTGEQWTRTRSLARAADRAVRAVRGLWPYGWDERVVVEAPASLERMADLLGGPASSYRGMAAVTIGAAGRSPVAPADRIVVNPEAYGALEKRSQQTVLTHETVHVATRTRTSAATPLWLSEGFADWVGHHGSGRTPQQIAPTLTRAVEAGKPPRALPGDAAFGFEGDLDRLGRAYESGWLACQLIAERWGERRLVELYAAVGGAGRRQPRAEVVDGALRTVLRVTSAEFTARWRAQLTRSLGR